MDSAASLARAAFALYEEEISEPDTMHVATLERIADCLWCSRDYDSYFRVMWQRVECLEKGFGPNDLRTLEALLGLGKSYKEQTRFGEAISVFHRVRDGLEHSADPDSSLLDGMLLSLAHSCLEQGSYAEAESSLTRLFSILEKKSSPDFDCLWCAFHELASLRLEQGMYAAAESSLTVALKLCHESTEPKPTLLAPTLNDLGLICFKTGRYVEAETLYVEAMEMWESAGSPGGVASALNNLGASITRRGDMKRLFSAMNALFSFAESLSAQIIQKLRAA